MNPLHFSKWFHGKLPPLFSSFGCRGCRSAGRPPRRASARRCRSRPPQAARRPAWAKGMRPTISIVYRYIYIYIIVYIYMYTHYTPLILGGCSVHHSRWQKLHNAILYFTIPYHTILHYTMLYKILCHTMPYCSYTMHYYAMPCHTIVQKIADAKHGAGILTYALAMTQQNGGQYSSTMLRIWDR